MVLSILESAEENARLHVLGVLFGSKERCGTYSVAHFSAEWERVNAIRGRDLSHAGCIASRRPAAKEKSKLRSPLRWAELRGDAEIGVC